MLMERRRVPEMREGGSPGEDGVGVPGGWLDVDNVCLISRSRRCPACEVAVRVAALRETRSRENAALSSVTPVTAIA